MNIANRMNELNKKLGGTKDIIELKNNRFMRIRK